jgi:hypothetical protein
MGDRVADLAAAPLDSAPGVIHTLQDSARVVAHSELALTVPRSSASVRSGRGWRETVVALREAGYPVLRPEPASSPVGDLALVLDYPDAALSDATPDATARRYEYGYAQAFKDTGWRRADLATLLRDARPVLCPADAVPAVEHSALILPHFLVRPTTAAADHGSAQSLLTAMAGCPSSKRVFLDPIETAGTKPALELSVARLPWPDAGADSVEGGSFADWIAGAEGQTELAALGWDPGPAAHGVDPADLVAAQHAYRLARSSARVLVAVDSSLSMKGRWQDVTAVVTALLGQLDSGDEAGLSTFVQTARGGARTVLRVAVDGVDRPAVTKRKGGRHRDLVLEKLAATAYENGDTPLSDAVATSVAQLAGRPSGSPDRGEKNVAPRDTVVVVTDGTDVVPEPNWPELRGQADAADASVLVVVLGTGAGAPLAGRLDGTLRQIVVSGDDVGQQVLDEVSSMFWRAEP